jgi:hypothetical protein
VGKPDQVPVFPRHKEKNYDRYSIFDRICRRHCGDDSSISKFKVHPFLSILLVSLVALWPVLDRRRERRGAEVQTLDSTVQVAATKVDSVQVLPEKAPAKADSAAKGPARAGKKTAPAKKEEKKPAADPAAIDEVFRQATEMFE